MLKWNEICRLMNCLRRNRPGVSIAAEAKLQISGIAIKLMGFSKKKKITNR